MDTHFNSLYRTASIDSDATADNLPGPGRNLGLLYKLLGQKLEDRIHTIASRRGAHSRPIYSNAVALPSIESTDTIDSNATASNLPGPGRNLGNLYSYLGNKLMNNLEGFLARRGYGPDSAARVIAHLRQHAKRDIRDMFIACAMEANGGLQLTVSEQRQLEKRCRQLVRYSKSKAEPTAISACNHIAELALYDPYIKKLLLGYLPSFNDSLLSDLEHGIGATEIDSDPLLASSRKALISVTEVDIQKRWSQFYVATAPGGLISSRGEDEFSNFMDSFLSEFNQWFLRGDTQALSFFGLRHILHNVQTTTAYVTSVHEDERWAAQSENLINITHHILSILSIWIQRAERDGVPAAVIDWSTLEDLLGREGREPVWMTQLRGLLSGSGGLDFGSHEIGIVEELDALFRYDNKNCFSEFSGLCQQKGRKWVVPSTNKSD